MSWQQIIMTLLLLEQATEIARKNGQSGVIDISLTFHQEAAGTNTTTDVTLPVGKISL